MSQPTKDIREANDALGEGMIGTGFQLLLMAVLFGGSAFFLQWGVWFIVVGWIVHSIVRKGSDAADWVWSKVPPNPFKADEASDHG